MQLKQKFIFPVTLMMVGLTIYSFHRLLWSNGDEAWHGAFLASAALPLYMAVFVAMGGAPRTSSRLLPVQIVTIIGVVVSASEPWPFVTALLSFLGLQWYVFVYSKYRRGKSSSIVLGQPLPVLVFETLEGARVSTEDFVGSKTLLVFFRGNWCPLCMAQLRELLIHAEQLGDALVQVKFISNQGIEKSRELVEKLSLPGHFEILHDHDLRAAKTLSIEDIGGAPPGLKGYPADTTMATVIALDAAGRVVFGDETDNYRVRPHPDSFIPIFEDDCAELYAKSS